MNPVVDGRISPLSQSMNPARHFAPASVSDERIVRRILDGDCDALELIMRRYNQRLFRIARSIVGDDADAEDAVQETYIRAFRHLGQFEGRATFATWLTRIAINEARSRRRKQIRSRFAGIASSPRMRWDDCSPDGNGELEASGRELGHVLAEAVDALPDDLRAVFTLRHVEGLGTSETAACLELTESNVRIRLHRAKRLLQTWIDRRLGEEIRMLYQFDGARCDRIVAYVRAIMSSI